MTKDHDFLRRQAIDEIEHYEARIQELQQRCEERRVFLRVLNEIDGKKTDATGVIAYSSSDEIADCVREVLRGSPEPMHISDLYDAVIERGLRINGRNPKGNLSAKLAPYNDIIYIRDKGWKLTTFRSRRLERRRRLQEQSLSEMEESGARNTKLLLGTNPKSPAGE